jgi:5-(carboxyamino)imidazole ribonucleotide mutase
MVKEKVVIIMGSSSDEEFAKPIWIILDQYRVPYEKRVISAHRRTQDLLDSLKEYETSGDNLVYVTVAGMSNALSGIVACNTKFAVIACPPYSEKFGGADVYSSLRMPKGVVVYTILEPENAALAAIKILAYGNSELYEKVLQYQQNMVNKNERDDKEIRKSSVVK